MGIKSASINNPGKTGVFPTIITILTEGDTLNDIMANGYLNSLKLNFDIQLSEYYMALVSIDPNPNVGNIQVGWFNISKSNDNWSLIFPTNLDVVLPTIPNHIATYINTTGTLSQDASTAINAGTIQAGLSGTPGAFISYPPAPNNGSLQLAAVNAGGNFQTSIANISMGQSTIYTIGDIGSSTGGLVVSTSIITRIRLSVALDPGTSSTVTVIDPFCTNTSNVIISVVSQVNPASVLTVSPQNGSFIVTFSAIPGNVGFSYSIIK